MITAAATSGVVLSHVIGHTITGAPVEGTSAAPMTMPGMAMPSSSASWAHLAPAPASLWTAGAVVLLVTACAVRLRGGTHTAAVTHPWRRLCADFVGLVALQATACLGVQLFDGHARGLTVTDVVAGPGARVAFAVQCAIAAGIALLLLLARRVGEAIARRRTARVIRPRRTRTADDFAVCVRTVRVALGRAPPLHCT